MSASLEARDRIAEVVLSEELATVLARHNVSEIVECWKNDSIGPIFDEAVDWSDDRNPAVDLKDVHRPSSEAFWDRVANLRSGSINLNFCPLGVDRFGVVFASGRVDERKSSFSPAIAVSAGHTLSVVAPPGMPDLADWLAPKD